MIVCPKYADLVGVMVFVIDDNSDIDVHVWSEIGNLICLRRLFSSTAVANCVCLENTYFTSTVRNEF